MGRGLSDLQKMMLTMQPGEYGDIDLKDVMAKYYGWPQNEYKRFPKEEIGKQKYMCGYIATRKAFDRLIARGRIFSGNRRYYRITEAGKKVLAKL